MKPTKPTDRFHKYLKPGALAQLRDFKISARSHKHKPTSLICLVDSLQPQQVSIIDFDQVPACLLTKIYSGPHSLRRKKLMPARSSCFLNLGPTSAGSLESSTNNNNSDSLRSVLNYDVLVAH